MSGISCPQWVLFTLLRGGAIKVWTETSKMLSNLMLGAQYCSHTHCEYRELQLEPSAFHAVRTYASADLEAEGSDEQHHDTNATATANFELELGENYTPPPISALFGLNMFGLTNTGMPGMPDKTKTLDLQIEAGASEIDAALTELDPGQGDEEASNMLVPPEAVEAMEMA